jgi:hypothetical protein
MNHHHGRRRSRSGGSSVAAAAAARSPIPPLQCVEIVGSNRGVGSSSAAPAAAAAAVAVPTAPPPPPVVTTTLLVKLAESCQTHFATRHANDETMTTTTVATTLEQAPCRSDLETLLAVLPRVEESIAAMTNTKSSSSSSNSNSNNNTQMFQLCHFYTDAMDGGFCPHATLLFLSAESSTYFLLFFFFCGQGLARWRDGICCWA